MRNKHTMFLFDLIDRKEKSYPNHLVDSFETEIKLIDV